MTPHTSTQTTSDPQLSAASIDSASVAAGPAGRSVGASPWSAKDYAAFVPGSGARKLAASAVAPLVAAARGYTNVGVDDHEDFAARRNLGDRRSKVGRQFRSLFMDGGDALIMPWYSLDKMQSTAQDLEAERETTIQYRPSNPRLNEQGKPVKYEFVVAAGTYLDSHPAVPRDWFSTTPRTLIAEGLLKGDSALTAMLRAWHPDAELAAQSADLLDRTNALRRLAALLSAIPQSERMSIISIAGVGNWRQNPEWFGVKVAEKDVYIAFDGDVDTNPHVWQMAAEMYSFLYDAKKARPFLVRLASCEKGAEALADDPKLGLDDFFAQHGNWADLDDMLEFDLPPRPVREGSASVGDWRVSKDGLVTQEFVEVETDYGSAGGRWVTRIGFGGRIVATETTRGVTDAESGGAPFGTGVPDTGEQTDVVIELKWKNHDDQILTREVRGPSRILGAPPAEWDRLGAKIPTDLELHPEWTPTKGRQWLAAVKSNDPGAIQSRTVWSTMGWVPVSGQDTQAFIIGEQVIARDAAAADATFSGVTDAQLANAGKFGLHDVYTGPGLTDPSGKYNLADDVRTILDSYIVNSPWLTQNIAVTMLATALRPAVPLPTSVAAYFVGAPQKGKSWSARQCMSFWQGHPGVWKHTLPGSANDTFATTESAIAKTPLWVIDDLAPSSDRRTAEMQEAKIGDLIRAVHNKLGKRRMKSDMTERDISTPMALTIITAENQSPVQSIRERVVNVEFTGLNAPAMIAADELANKDTAAARVTAAIIRMYIQLGQDIGWKEMTRTLREEREGGIDNAKSILQHLGIAVGDASRPAEIAADLAMGLMAFRRLLGKLGMREERKQISWMRQDAWLFLLAQQVGLAHHNKKEMSPGRVLLDCISRLLSSGQAHIANFDNPANPPISGENASTTNTLLGWQADADGGMRPRGTNIGFLHMMTSSDKPAESDEVFYINAKTAFELVSEKYRGSILPGSQYSDVWRNVWDLGLTHPRYAGGERRNLERDVRVKGTGGKATGVPLSLEALLGASPTDEQEG